jgi:hypothetical protein
LLAPNSEIEKDIY